MPTLRFEIVVARPIDHVWAAFQEITTLLPALTPPEQELKIESVAPLPPQPGTTVTMSAKGPLGRVRWVARYADFVPPHATVTGIEARFVDEQLQGPFKRFVQSHEFEAASDRTTRCTDVIDYTPPFGPLGWIGNALIIRRTIDSLFAYRQKKMVEVFGRV